MVGFLDLRARGQSDVTSEERRGIFDDLRLSRFLLSGEQESQWGWCMFSRKVNEGDACFRVSPISFTHSLSLSLRAGVLVCGYHLPSFDQAPRSRNLSFIAFLSSGRIILSFLCFSSRKSRIGRKITFSYLYLFDNVHRHFGMRWSYAQKPLFPFWRKFQNR